LKCMSNWSWDVAATWHKSQKNLEHRRKGYPIFNACFAWTDYIGFLTRRPMLNHMALNVRFVMDKVPFGQVFFLILWFLPVNYHSANALFYVLYSYILPQKMSTVRSRNLACDHLLFYWSTETPDFLESLWNRLVYDEAQGHMQRF
jgi:hypothetical protein